MKKILLPLALLGTTLFAASSMADNYTVPATGNLGDFFGIVNAAVVVDSDALYWQENFTWNGIATIPGGGHLFNLGSFTINDTVAKVFVAGIATDDAASSYTLGQNNTITVNASGRLAGFISQSGGNFANRTINLGTLTIHNTGTVTTPDGGAYGLVFLNNTNGNAANFNGTAVANAVNVTADTGTAMGWYSGNVLGRLDIGDVNVNSTRGDAFGVHIDGGITDLTLNGNISVTGAGRDTSGIRTYNAAALNLERDVTIATNYTGSNTWQGADIRSGGNTTINLNGNNLTAGRIQLDSARNLNIEGRGRAELGSVRMSGTFTIGDVYFNKTTVSLDGKKMLEDGGYLGNVVISPVSTLEIYGDTDIQEIIGLLAYGEVEQVVNRSTFTRWGVDEYNRIQSFGVSDRALANDNYLAAGLFHQKYTGWYAVRDHLISGSNKVHQRFGYYGQSPCECVKSCSSILGCKKVKNRGAWINYVGRKSEYQSSHYGNTWDLSTEGVQAGTDIFRTRNKQFGLFFGYEDSRGATPSIENYRDRITGEDYYVGLYGVHVFSGGADIRTVFNAGWQSYTSQRYGNTGQLYRSAFDGNTYEANIEFGKRHYFSDYYGAWSFRPAIALDWYMVQLHGGQETPTNAQAIRYGSTNFSQLFFRFGTDFRVEHGRWAAEAGLFYSHDLRGSDYWAEAASTTEPGLRSSLVSSKLGKSVLSFNFGGSYLLCNNLTLFGGYQGETIPAKAGKGYTGNAYIGGAWRW